MHINCQVLKDNTIKYMDFFYEDDIQLQMQAALLGIYYSGVVDGVRGN